MGTFMRTSSSFARRFCRGRSNLLIATLSFVIACDSESTDDAAGAGGSGASGGSGGSQTGGNGAGAQGGIGGDGGTAGDGGGTTSTGGGGAGTGGSGGAGTGGGGGGNVDPGATLLSYLGGSSSTEAVGDMGRDIAVDAQGNVYVTGGLDRMNGGPFTGALGHSFGNRDDEDIYVVSFDRDGALRYATIIGGPNYDRAYAIEVDANGRAIVAGRAGNGFPTTAGVVQPSFAGDNNPNGPYGTQDGVIFTLEADGTLAWATYLGGGGRDFIRDIDLGADGSIYAAATSAVGAYPHATPGAFITTPPSGANVVLVKVSPDGQSVLWGGYLGGSGDETSPPAVRVNAAGEAFVVWSSSASDVPVTAGAYQSTPAGGADLVVARVAADGGSLLYCTYLGGPGDELVETHQIALDGSQAVVVTALSAGLPSVTGYQQTITGGRDLLLAKLSANGSAVVASTYLGGSGDEHAEGIMVAPTGEVYVTGSTPSANFPTTPGSFQPAKAGAADAIVAILSPNLDALTYSTFVGGNNADQLRSVAIGPDLEILGAGQTASTNLAVTPAALQAAYGGGPSDAMYLRLPRP